MNPQYSGGLLWDLKPPAQPTNRKVNVVRNAWRFINPGNILYPTFYDSTLWESKKLEGDDAVKRLIREGVEYTSAVCILVGTSTWNRRWVKYEIARSVIDKRGLLAIHLNGINHHQSRLPEQHGLKLHFMAVGKVQNPFMSTPQYYLFERTTAGWERYADYRLPIQLS